MAKFRERELEEKLKEFANESKIEISLDGSVDGKIILEDTTIIYDERNGFININTNSGTIKINTTLVCRYEEIEKNIYILLETETIKIRKI